MQFVPEGLGGITDSVCVLTSLPMPEPHLIALALLVVFCAGVVQGLTGFGFGIVAVPILTIFISPKLAAPMTLLNSLVLNAMILQRSPADADLGRIWPLVLAGLAGVPLGAWVLVNADVDTLRIDVGATTVVFTLLFLSGFRREVSHEKLASIPIGFVSGLMQGSINMAGPPVILFLTNQGLPRHVFRASIVAYFLILSLLTLPLLVAGGILNGTALVAALIVLPGLLAGGLIGTRLIHSVDEAHVRKLTLFIVLGAGVSSLLSGLDVL
jgi:uncharacterized protein